jgi:hypothetical protein
MNAQPAAQAAVPSVVAPAMGSAATTGAPMLAILRALLLSEAALTLVLAVFFSLLAAALRDFLGGELGRQTEESVRFAAGGAFLFAIFAAVASRGVRRRRRWSWTMAAILQVILAVGTGVAVLVAEWHPVYLAGFGAAAIVMLVLSVSSVRDGLGQH